MKVEINADHAGAVEAALASGQWATPEAFIGELLDDYQASQLSPAEQEQVGKLVDEAWASGEPIRTTPGQFIAAVRSRLKNKRSA